MHRRTDEARALDGSIDIENTGEEAGDLPTDADGAAVETGKAHNDVFA